MTVIIAGRRRRVRRWCASWFRPTHGKSLTSRLDKTSGRAGKGAGGTPGKAGSDAVGGSFADEFAMLRLRVIRPAFEALADWLKARGNEVEISEEPDGSIAIRIVPRGVDRNSRPQDRFPTFSVFGSSFTNTIGLQSRNPRPDSAAAAGSRSVHTLGQINNAMLEAELMRFVDEIGQWQNVKPE